MVPALVRHRPGTDPDSPGTGRQFGLACARHGGKGRTDSRGHGRRWRSGSCSSSAPASRSVSTRPPGRMFLGTAARANLLPGADLRDHPGPGVQRAGARERAEVGHGPPRADDLQLRAGRRLGELRPAARHGGARRPAALGLPEPGVAQRRHVHQGPGHARILADHIATVVGHYKGRIAQWDVVNEPFAPERQADRPPSGRRSSAAGTWTRRSRWRTRRTRPPSSS